jgi:hypothetical protein
MRERPCCKPGIVRRPAVLASGDGQETNQFTEDDVEFSDMGWRSVYAAAVHVLGAFSVAHFLGEIESQDRAAPDGQPGAAVPT